MKKKPLKFYNELTEEEKEDIIYLPSAIRAKKSAAEALRAAAASGENGSSANGVRLTAPHGEGGPAESAPSRKAREAKGGLAAGGAAQRSPFWKAPREWHKAPEEREPVEAAPFFESSPGFKRHYAELTEEERENIIYLPDERAKRPIPAAARFSAARRRQGEGRGQEGGDVIIFQRPSRYPKAPSMAVSFALMAALAAGLMTKGLDQASQKIAEMRPRNEAPPSATAQHYQERGLAAAAAGASAVVKGSSAGLGTVRGLAESRQKQPVTARMLSRRLASKEVSIIKADKFDRENTERGEKTP